MRDEEGVRSYEGVHRIGPVSASHRAQAPLSSAHCDCVQWPSPDWKEREALSDQVDQVQGGTVATSF
jgi:hypothetical protein